MKQDEDLFKDTTMTFGEHLEDLRTALFKALFGLVVGTLLGLTVGDRFVLMLERPLTKALGEFYRTDAETRYIKFHDEQEAQGKSSPYTIEQVRALVHHGWVFDLYYGHPHGAPEVKVPSAMAEDVDAKENLISTELQAAFEPKLYWRQVENDERVRLKAFGAPEAFSIWLKASLVIGAVLSSPWVFYHIWAFVAAGLYPHEKRYVHFFLPFSLGLFLLGAATAYFFVFGPVLNFLFGFNSWLGIDPDPRISEWLSFVLLLPLGFGISFQLPLVMLFIERIGVFTVKDYLQKWRLAVLVIFVLSAILTPADPYSLLLMALPLTFLYFFGVLLCHYLPRQHAPLAD